MARVLGKYVCLCSDFDYCTRHMTVEQRREAGRLRAIVAWFRLVRQGS